MSSTTASEGILQSMGGMAPIGANTKIDSMITKTVDKATELTVDPINVDIEDIQEYKNLVISAKKDVITFQQGINDLYTKIQNKRVVESELAIENVNNDAEAMSQNFEVHSVAKPDEHLEIFKIPYSFSTDKGYTLKINDTEVKFDPGMTRAEVINQLTQYIKKDGSITTNIQQDSLDTVLTLKSDNKIKITTHDPNGDEINRTKINLFNDHKYNFIEGNKTIITSDKRDHKANDIHGVFKNLNEADLEKLNADMAKIPSLAHSVYRINDNTHIITLDELSIQSEIFNLNAQSKDENLNINKEYEIQFNNKARNHSEIKKIQISDGDTITTVSEKLNDLGIKNEIKYDKDALYIKTIKQKIDLSSLPSMPSEKIHEGWNMEKSIFITDKHTIRTGEFDIKVKTTDIGQVFPVEVKESDVDAIEDINIAADHLKKLLESIKAKFPEKEIDINNTDIVIDRKSDDQYFSVFESYVTADLLRAKSGWVLMELAKGHAVEKDVILHTNKFTDTTVNSNNAKVLKASDVRSISRDYTIEFEWDKENNITSALYKNSAGKMVQAEILNSDTIRIDELGELQILNQAKSISITKDMGYIDALKLMSQNVTSNINSKMQSIDIELSNRREELKEAQDKIKDQEASLKSAFAKMQGSMISSANNAKTIEKMLRKDE